MSVRPSIFPSVQPTRVEFLRNVVSGLNLNKIASRTWQKTWWKHEENMKKNWIKIRGYSKKKCQLSCSFVFCWSLLLFYSEMVYKQWLKVWFLISRMPILSGRIDFVPFSTTSNFCFQKIPMKYSKNGQKFAMSKNPSNMLFNTCWTPCKKSHVATRSRSWYTFFWITPYLRCKIWWSQRQNAAQWDTKYNQT